MPKNTYWMVLLVIICVVLFGCVNERSDYDIDEIVDELVESTKHHAEQPMADKPEDKKTDPDPAEQTDAVEEVRVSPHGFGPYPDIPADFPRQDIFEQGGQGPNFELMDRVWLELWKRGVRGISGMSISHNNGLVYPTIRGIAYADWEPRWELFGFGFGKKYSGWSGHPGDFPRDPDIGRPKMPRGIKIFDMSEGIDPYKLLDLPKEGEVTE
ncbi:MAG: hypothetical protein OXM61_03215 [Candidatus Poribacteria bacterium]|nr:hypothetical protein [Candidatus Poribacteria bacterium]